jgi:hypothetical protein
VRRGSCCAGVPHDARRATSHDRRATRRRIPVVPAR